MAPALNTFQDIRQNQRAIKTRDIRQIYWTLKHGSYRPLLHDLQVNVTRLTND